ncbi:MAG: flagellar biosynthesis protein FlhF [Lachnospiraceae bacterium]|nr:flagellar biosynthesis protein FlhF [Lachnospiraceae bacterium]
MIIKKFTGKTEEEATKAAKAELGPAAVPLNVRKIKHKGFFGFMKRQLYEVTAAVEEESDNPSPKPKNAPRTPLPDPVFSGKGMFKDILPEEEPPRTEDGKGDKAIEEKIDNLHTLIEQQLKNVMETGEAEAGEPADKPMSEEERKIMNFLKLIYNTLVNNEVDEKYANEMVDEIEKLKKPGVTIDYLLSNIYQRLILKFGEPGRIRISEKGARTVFFLGPTGVGKTTTIAKIASRFCVNEKRKVALVTTDTYRIKAAEQLKTYAEILEVPFRVAYNSDDLKEAIQEYKDYDFILVDTAGYSPKDKEKRMEMKQLLSEAATKTEAEIYLVLSVTTKYRDLLNISDLYKKMTDYRLIFTKLDETDAYGCMLNLRMHTGAEIAYITNGQSVPDDIEVFNPQSIVRALLSGEKPEDRQDEGPEEKQGEAG